MEVLMARTLLRQRSCFYHQRVQLQQIVVDPIGIIVPHFGLMGTLCGFKHLWCALFVQNVPRQVKRVYIDGKQIHENA